MASATRCAEFEELAFAGLDGMQRLRAPRQGLGVVLVILRSAGVEVPADVVEALRRIGDHRGHLGRRLLLQEVEADHHVGDLHAGVVDVVLHLDPPAARAHHAHEGVAEDGVAQMPDVRRLVGIDVGVLDDDLLAGRRGIAGVGGIAQQSRRVSAAIEADVDVTVAGDLERRDAGDRSDVRRSVRRQSSWAPA